MLHIGIDLGTSAAKLLWMRENEPELFTRIARIMLPKDYINYILTGVHCTDCSDASGTLLLDVEHKRWSREMLGLCGVSEAQMPRLFESCEAVGTLRPGVAKRLGLPENVVVCAGAGDNAAAAVGAGFYEGGSLVTVLVILAELLIVVWRQLMFWGCVPGRWEGKLMIIEAIGYIGSLLVVASMLMTSVMKLRIINTVGSSIFAVYALLIHSYPTALMNLALVLINLHNMRKLIVASSTNYSLVEENVDSPFVQYFLQRNRQDIEHFFPEFCAGDGSKRAYLVCCADLPVGALIGETTKNGGIKFTLDYTTPAYRDCSVGTFLYQSLAEKGVTELICTGDPPNHRAYLLKMGFRMIDGDYVKTLAAL